MFAAVERPLVIRVGAYPHWQAETTAWEQAAYAAAGLEFEYYERLDDYARSRLGGASAVVTSLVYWEADALELLERCRVLVSCSVGLDWIDVPAAERRGVAVVSMPTVCTTEVADHTLALMLAALRKIPALTQRVQGGLWDRKLLEGIPRLSELTLGLVGTGRVGRAVALRAAPFGFTVIGFDPYAAPVSGIAPVDLATVCRESDVISLHVPLLPQTQAIIGQPELSAMKPTAVLVNTSRGGLIDQVALAQALQDGRLRYAALDVLAREPPDVDEPLLQLDNVILSPHAAGYSDAVVWDIPRIAFDWILEYLRPEDLAAVADDE